jgi:hypothetical protein
MSLLERLTDDDRHLTRTGGEARLLERIRSEFYGARAAWNRVSVNTIFVLAETRGWPQIPVPGEVPYADRYIDGGILDNTPLATALTALREAEAEAKSGSETHEMLVVLLSPRKRGRYLAATKAAALEGPALGLRALRLQAEGRIEDDVRNAEKIDRLLAEKGWAEGELAAEAHKQAEAAAAAAAARPSAAAVGESWSEIFSKERGDENGTEAPASALDVDEERLVRVQVTRVYPTWDLPWILSLDHRLGFRADDARQFQVRGCRDTLTALSARYGDQVRTGHEVPAGARLAVEWTASQGGSVATGWICPTERCSLRATCDLVARDERAQAETEGAAARA